MKATYRDVKADILQKIVDGTFGPGALLPNEVDLAERYGCARATINRAMRELAEDGLLDRKRKAGTRVRLSPLREARFSIPVIRKEIEEQGAEYRYALVNEERRTAPDWLRARLKLDPESMVRHLVCMHYADGIPYQHEDRWINLTALPAARDADFSLTGPNEWLVSTVPLTDVEISFSATKADDTTAEHLGCTRGEALFMAERSTWWQDRAITFVRLRFRPGYRMTTRY